MNFLLALLTPWAFAATAPVECDDLYFGVSQPQDLKAAFACLQKAATNPDDDYSRQLLALMHLNGEATKKDPVTAKKVLGPADMGMALRLAQEIKKQIKKPSNKKIDFCDLAEAQQELNACGFRSSAIATRLRKEAEARTPEKAKPALAKVTQAHDAYCEASSNESMAEYEGGSIAPLIGAGTQTACENGYQNLLETKFIEVDSSKLAAHDKALNEKYKAMMAKMSGDTKKLARETQKKWLVFRDAFADWVAVKDPQSKVAAMARVTELRVKDFESWLKDQASH